MTVFPELLVAPTGALVHLIDPTTPVAYSGGGLQAACSTRGDWRAIEYGGTPPPLPLCARCLSRWRFMVDAEHRWRMERIDDLRAQVGLAVAEATLAGEGSRGTHAGEVAEESSGPRQPVGP